MRLSLAIQTPEVRATVPVALLSGSLAERLAKAAGLGYAGVELMVADPAQLDAAELAFMLSQHGLGVAAVGSGAVAFSTGLVLLHADAAVCAQAEARLHDLIRFAAAVGAPLVTIGSFRGRASNVGADARTRLAGMLRAAAGLAADVGVRLALEPLNRYESDLINTAEQGLAFVAQVGHPALGLLLDTYHVNIEERSWTEPFRLLMDAELLWHVHLGDNNRLPPGQGLIDFGAIIRTLRACGYTGYLSAELLARPDPDAAARETIAYMRPLLEVTT
ncbi:MAG: sugar phosphate isomerase/epimerase family protein [Anaerolineae bacterium]